MNNTHSPIAAAYDLGEQTRTQFLKTLTLEQKRLLEKMQSCRDDVFEFAYQRNIDSNFNKEICDDSEEYTEISKSLCDFNDVDVNQI